MMCPYGGHHHRHHLSLNQGFWGHHRWLHNQFPPFFPVLHCPLGLGELQACLFFDVVFPPLPPSTLSSSPFHCALQDGFGQTWWTGDMTLLLQFVSLYNGQEIFEWSDCLLDLGTDFLLVTWSLYEMHHHQSLNREGHWGTTDDFATSFLHSSLFSTALWDLLNSRPVHSLMLSGWIVNSQKFTQIIIIIIIITYIYNALNDALSASRIHNKLKTILSKYIHIQNRQS